VGSTISGAGNVTLNATGGGSASNITATDAQINAGGAVSLSADNAVTLQSAQGTSNSSNTSSSSGQSGGVGLSVGAQNGLVFQGSLSQANGSGTGASTTQYNTHVTGDTVTINSGGDTTLHGAVVTGNRVVANVGGNLDITSLQDTSTSTSRQSSAGLNVSVCYWFCVGQTVVGSVGGGSSHASGNYASVTEQSGIQAGDGGFAVNVVGNTNLHGGVIASTNVAVDSGLNSFSTGSLTMSYIQNTDAGKGSGYSLDVGIASGSTGANGTVTAGGGLNGGGVGIGSAGGTQTSLTFAGISGFAGNAAVRTGDQAGTLPHQYSNANDLLREVDAQVLITGSFGPIAANLVGKYAQSQRDDLLMQAEQAPDEATRQSLLGQASLWDEGGAYRVALHTIIGALTGGSGGAAGAAASSLSVPYIAALINETDLPDSVRAAAILVASAALGASVGGGLPGAASAYNEVLNNCLANSCLSIKWDKNAPGYHFYGPIVTPVLCNTSEIGCLDAVKHELACRSAPGQPRCSIPGDAQSGPMMLTGDNYITQFLSADGMTVINGTEPGHMFDDGYIVRYINIDGNGNVTIATSGEGVNQAWFGGLVGANQVANTNATMGAPLFQAIGVANAAMVRSTLALQGIK
jgi:filamentous hemagglutinin